MHTLIKDIHINSRLKTIPRKFSEKGIVRKNGIVIITGKIITFDFKNAPD